MAKVEEQIEQLESKVAELEAALTAASTNGEYMKIESLGAQYTQAEADLHAAMEEWGRLVE